MRTSRIVLNVDRTMFTVYTTSQNITALKEQGLLVQLGQKYFPVKGETPKLLKEMFYLSARNPDSFADHINDFLKQFQPNKRK